MPRLKSPKRTNRSRLVFPTSAMPPETRTKWYGGLRQPGRLEPSIYAEPSQQEKLDSIGTAVIGHLKERTIAPAKPTGMWLDPGRLSGTVQPSLYGEPDYKWQYGEVDPPGVKLAQGALTLTQKAYKIADSGKHTLKQLQDKAKALNAKNAELLKAGKFEEAADVAFEHQMWREAAEKMQGAPQHKSTLDINLESVRGTVHDRVGPLLEQAGEPNYIEDIHLVGSRAKGTSRAKSDYDFVVKVKDLQEVATRSGKFSHEYASRLADLEESIENALKGITINGRKADFFVTPDIEGKIVKLKPQAGGKKQFSLEDSIVTDRNIPGGEPKTVYHGTRSGDFDKFESDTGLHYFTELKKYAKDYSNLDNPKIVKANLRIENPLEISDINIGDEIQFREFVEQIDEFGSHRVSKDVADEWSDIYDAGDYLYPWEVINSAPFKKIITKHGFDGVRMEEGLSNVWVATSPDQIKILKKLKPQAGEKLGHLVMPKGMVQDASVGRLTEPRTVRQRGVLKVPEEGPSITGLPEDKMGMLAYEQRKAKILNGMEEVKVNEFQKSVKGAANYFHAFNDDISEASTEYLKWVDKNRNKSTIHVNGKTGISADLSTDCPNRATGACPHCYLEPARIDVDEAKKAGIFIGHGKKVVETPYRNEIMGMPADLVNALNRDGGLRMFSAGDYRGKKMFKGPDGIIRSDYDQLKLMLEHAKEKNLFIKAITKQKELIDDFASHPNMRINLSTDELPRIMSNAPTPKEALKWAGDHKNIKIRSVAFNKAQGIEHLESEGIDVVTMYHGPTNFLSKRQRDAYLNPKNKNYIKDPTQRKRIESYPWDEEHKMYRTNKMIQIIERGNPEMYKRAGRKALLKETDTWVDHQPQKGVMKELNEKYPGRLCCTGWKCPSGATKCGWGVGMATLIAGIYLPEWETEEEQ